jgi:site-specific DNA-methyltransferase (adenine-specific)
VIYCKRESDGVHRTEKPLRLLRGLIMNSFDEGDLVYDPFLGSGSTGVAAMRVGCDCVGTELDPLNVETIVDRMTRNG